MSSRQRWSILAVLAIAACDGDPVSVPDSPQFAVVGGFSIPEAQLGQNTREVTIDVPAELPPWVASPDALVEAVGATSGEVLIALKDSASPRTYAAGGLRRSVRSASLRAAIVRVADAGVTDGRLIGTLGILVGNASPEALRALHGSPWVDFIEPNGTMQLHASARRTSAVPLPAQSISWGVTMVGAATGWSIGATGDGATVMIIDGGMNDGHEDLPDLNSANCFGYYGGCTDVGGHGSHVAGDLLGRNNSVGYKGVAYGVDDEDVYTWAACDWVGECDVDEVTSGIYKADSLGIDVLNMSLGSTTYYGTIASAVSTALSGGIFVVASAGNNTGSTPVYPAALSYVVAVSGVQTDTSFASTDPCSGDGSGYGNYIDVAAPFWSTAADSAGGYTQRCGNSFGAALVSGIGALIRAKWPTLSNYAVRQRIRETAIDKGAAGYDSYFGHGLVSAANALGPFTDIEGFFDLEDNQTCSWNGVVWGGFGSITQKWYVDGYFQGSGASFEWDVDETSFWLAFEATDAHGIVSTKSVYVNVSGSGYACPE